MDSTRVYVSLGMMDSPKPRSKRRLMSRSATRRTLCMLALLGMVMTVWLVCCFGSMAGLFDRLGSAWRFGKTAERSSAQADAGADVVDTMYRQKEFSGSADLKRVSDERRGIGSPHKDDADDEGELRERSDGVAGRSVGGRSVGRSSPLSRRSQIGNKDISKKSNQEGWLPEHDSESAKNKDAPVETGHTTREGGMKQVKESPLGRADRIDVNKILDALRRKSDRRKSPPVKEAAAKPFEYGREKIGVRYKVPGGKQNEAKEFVVNTNHHGADARKMNALKKANAAKGIPAQAKSFNDKLVSNEILQEQLQQLKTDLKKSLGQKQQDKEKKAKSKKRQSKSGEHPVPIVFVPQKGEDPYRDLSEDLAKLVASVQQSRSREDTLPPPRRHHSYL